MGEGVWSTLWDGWNCRLVQFIPWFILVQPGTTWLPLGCINYFFLLVWTRVVLHDASGGALQGGEVTHMYHISRNGIEPLMAAPALPLGVLDVPDVPDVFTGPRRSCTVPGRPGLI